MVIDEERVFYEMFGLKRSFKKVWSIQTLVYYAEQVCLQRELPKSYEEVEDDPHQMGGDFILEHVSEKVQLVMAYRSQSPPDRPKADQLIQFLRQIQI